MYKVETTKRGKYNNIKIGARYFLFKKEALKCYKMFLEEEAEPNIFKFTRLHFGVYAWSDEKFIDTIIDLRMKMLEKNS